MSGWPPTESRWYVRTALSAKDSGKRRSSNRAPRVPERAIVHAQRVMRHSSRDPLIRHICTAIGSAYFVSANYEYEGAATLA